MRIILYILFVTAALTLAGCALPTKEPMRICPGAGSIENALELLNSHKANIKPIKANGKLIYKQYHNGKRKSKESIDTKLRYYPPDHLFFQGNYIAGQAFKLGANQNQFWLRIKLDVNSYWYGSRNLGWKCNKLLKLISPDNLTEAIGLVNLDDSMKLSNRNGYDILTSYTDTATPAKKVYINCCSYLVTKIEYFDIDGQISVIVELNNYTNTADGIVIPAKIRFTSFDSDTDKTQLDITFKNVKLFSPKPKILNDPLFKLPPTKGFKNIYQLNENCQFIKQ